MFLDAHLNLSRRLRGLSPDEIRAVLSFLDRSFVDQTPATIAIYECATRQEVLYPFAASGKPDPEEWHSRGAVTFTLCKPDCQWFVVGKSAEVLACTDTHVVLGVFA